MSHFLVTTVVFNFCFINCMFQKNNSEGERAGGRRVVTKIAVPLPPCVVLVVSLGETSFVFYDRSQN